MNLTPLGSRVLIRPEARKTETAGGIVLSETTYQPEFCGTVVSVGPEVVDVRPRDRVIFGIQSGQELWVEREKLLIMRETDVLAICEVIT